MLKLKIGIKSF